MTEQPFDQNVSSGIIGQDAFATGEVLELRYPPLLRALVPCSVLFSGIVAAAILFLTLSFPLNLIGLPMLMADGFMAAFLWFQYNNGLLRVDTAGITKVVGMRTESLRWDEVASHSTEVVRTQNGSLTRVTLKNAAGNIVMTFDQTLGTQEERERLMRTIKERTAGQ